MLLMLIFALIKTKILLYLGNAVNVSIIKALIYITLNHVYAVLNYDIDSEKNEDDSFDNKVK